MRTPTAGNLNRFDGVPAHWARKNGFKAPIYERTFVKRGGADFVLNGLLSPHMLPSPSASVNLAQLRTWPRTIDRAPTRSSSGG